MLLAAPVLLLVIFMITARLSLAYKLRQRRKRGESARTMVVLGSGRSVELFLLQVLLTSLILVPTYTNQTKLPY